MIERIGNLSLEEIEKLLERGFLISGNQRITKEESELLSSHYRLWKDWESRWDGNYAGARDLSTLVEMEHLSLDEWAWIEDYEPRWYGLRPHGHYNSETQRPDNRMQVVGSGTDVWLNQQVLNLLGKQRGQVLIERSAAQGAHRYKWLCEQMAEREHPELTEQYHQKQKDAAAEKRLAEKRRDLQGYRVRLVQTPTSDETTRKYLRRQIEKAEKYIYERTRDKE